MLKEVLNDALHNLHAESGALTSSAIVSIDGLRHCCPWAAKPPACSLAAISIK